MNKFIIFILVAFYLGSCEEEKRLNILNIELNNETHLNWYVHSSITSFSPSYVELKTHTLKKVIIKSYYLTDVRAYSKTLFFQFTKDCDYTENDFRYLEKLGYMIVIDRFGKDCNLAPNRIGRLQSKVDITKPHSKNSDGGSTDCFF